MTNAIANFESEVPDEYRMLMEEFELVDMGLARGFEEGQILTGAPGALEIPMPTKRTIGAVQ